MVLSGIFAENKFESENISETDKEKNPKQVFTKQQTDTFFCAFVDV